MCRESHILSCNRIVIGLWPFTRDVNVCVSPSVLTHVCMYVYVNVGYDNNFHNRFLYDLDKKTLLSFT